MISPWLIKVDCKEQMYTLYIFLFKKCQQLISELSEMCSNRGLGEIGNRRPVLWVLMAKVVMTDGRNGKSSAQGIVKRNSHLNSERRAAFTKSRKLPYLLTVRQAYNHNKL